MVWLRPLFICSAWLILASGRAAAQGNTRDFDRPGPAAEREAYYARVRMEVNGVLGQWKDAWDADNADGLSKLYAPDASYLPPGAASAQGRDAIRDYLATILPASGSADVRMTDFGTSGDLAYVTARVTHQAGGGAGAPRKLVRTDLLVLRRIRNTWQIVMHLPREES
jgi:uncharacterized protein (TIGR02246 family)